VESGAFKGLEFVLIVAVVAWFYFSQMHNLKRLKQEREAKQGDAASPAMGTEKKTD
jgi:hypothetical protein